MWKSQGNLLQLQPPLQCRLQICRLHLNVQPTSVCDHTVKNGFEMRVCWAQLHFSIPAEWNDPEAGPSPRVTRTNIYNPNLGFASLTRWWRIEMFTFNLFVAKLKTGKAATNILHPTSNLNIECCTQRERVIFLVANREIKTSLFSRLQCLHSLL